MKRDCCIRVKVPIGCYTFPISLRVKGQVLIINKKSENLGGNYIFPGKDMEVYETEQGEDGKKYVKRFRVLW